MFYLISNREIQCWNFYVQAVQQMAGRRRKIPLDVLYGLFETNQKVIINEKGSVVAPKNEIWKIFSNDQAINNKMTSKAIYTEALNWWAKRKHDETGSGDEQNEHKSLENSDISLEVSSPNATKSDESYKSSSHESNSESKSSDINFSITLSHDVWQTIQPVAKEYKRKEKKRNSKIKTYYVLEPGLWTHILIERIAQHRINNPCTWSFKRAKVYNDGKIYIKLFARCATCGAHLIGQVPKKPKRNEEVKFKFTVRNFSETKHKEGRKNVRIGGSKAKELFSSNKIASVLKRDMIRDSGAEMFETVKGRDVSENAIRAGQSRHRQLSKLSPSPLQAIEYLQVSHTYGPMIHMTGLNKFFCIYNSSNQFAMYNAYKKKNKHTKITADATGSIVHKIRMNHFILILF